MGYLFRGTHPLYTIIEQKRTNDFINTFLDQYEKGGILPIWELAGNYTGWDWLSQYSSNYRLR